TRLGAAAAASSLIAKDRAPDREPEESRHRPRNRLEIESQLSESFSAAGDEVDRPSKLRHGVRCAGRAHIHLYSSDRACGHRAAFPMVLVGKQIAQSAPGPAAASGRARRAWVMPCWAAVPRSAAGHSPSGPIPATAAAGRALAAGVVAGVVPGLFGTGGRD